jgi:hypothetical protein
VVVGVGATFAGRVITALLDITAQQFGEGLQQLGAITGEARPQPVPQLVR